MFFPGSKTCFLHVKTNAKDTNLLCHIHQKSNKCFYWFAIFRCDLYLHIVQQILILPFLHVTTVLLYSLTFTHLISMINITKWSKTWNWTSWKDTSSKSSYLRVELSLERYPLTGHQNSQEEEHLAGLHTWGLLCNIEAVTSIKQLFLSHTVLTTPSPHYKQNDTMISFCLSSIAYINFLQELGSVQGTKFVKILYFFPLIKKTTTKCQPSISYLNVFQIMPNRN